VDESWEEESISEGGNHKKTVHQPSGSLDRSGLKSAVPMIGEAAAPGNGFNYAYKLICNGGRD
jgi:hypothetical protein